MILLLGVFLFLLSSIYFLLEPKKSLNSGFLISFVTLISYLLMLQGSFVSSSPLEEPIYYTRWILYAVSCSLLMWEISQVVGFKTLKTTENILLTVIVMLTGAFAATQLGMFKPIFFALSSIAYVLLIKNIFSKFTKKSAWVKPFIIYGWSVFPVVFFFAPEGLGALTAVLANGAYLILDMYTKVYFSYKLHQSS